MKVRVDFDLCEANAVCVGQAPDVFHVDDEDHLHVKMAEIPERLRADVEAAVRMCPRQALSLEE